MNVYQFFVGFILGAFVGVIFLQLFMLRVIRKSWKTCVMGLTDFDIKCINEEYAKRKRMMEQEGKA